jgi:hypothetical protein
MAVERPSRFHCYPQCRAGNLHWAPENNDMRGMLAAGAAISFCRTANRGDEMRVLTSLPQKDLRRDVLLTSIRSRSGSKATERRGERRILIERIASEIPSRL